MNRHQPSCLPDRAGDLMAPLHFNVHGQVAVTHSGRSVHEGIGVMRSSVFVLAAGQSLPSEQFHDRRGGRSAYSSSGHASEGPPLLLGHSPRQDSVPRPASDGGLFDGVGCTRRVEIRQHGRKDRPTRWVVQQSEALGWSTPRTPNHRVEMNRHQPPCLPGLLDSLIAAVHSNLLGQVAVTHPGRSGTVRRASGCSRWSESNLSWRFGRGAGRSG